GFPGELIPNLRTAMSCFCVKDAEQGWKEKTDSRGWPFFDRGISTTFPAPVRKRTLLLAMWPSPYHLKLLTADERACYAVLSRLTRAHMQKAGFRALEIGRNYPPTDYADWVHLSESGGARMAEEVAPVVRDLARRLGYVRWRLAGAPRRLWGPRPDRFFFRLCAALCTRPCVETVRAVTG